MKLLITGAVGFIGSHAVERFLSEGFEVVGLDNFDNYYDKRLKVDTGELLKLKGASILNLDLRNAEAYRLLPTNFDFIIHFAAQPGISSSSSFNDYFSNNIIATQLLVQFAHKNKNLKHFINIGTSSIYGEIATKDETSVPSPVSWYGITKLAAEQLVLAEARLEKFKASSLRLYSVYGPRERPDKLYTKLIDCAVSNKPFTLYQGSDKHKRSFTFIDDIIDGIHVAVKKHEYINLEIINLGNTKEHSTLEGVKMIEKLLNKKIKIKIADKRKGEQVHTRACIDKAQRLLNYHPITTLETGLKKQIEWFNSN